MGILVMCSRGYSPGGKLSHELKAAISLEHGVCDKTTLRIWNKYKDRIMAGKGFTIQRKEGSGRKLKYSVVQLSETIRNVPRWKRKTLRSLSHATGIPKSTIDDYINRGLLKRSRNSVKPKLRPENMQHRVDFVKSKVEEDGRFSDLYTDVHIDEKWFYIMKIDDRCILLPEEEAEHRECQHKNHIGKVMFGAVVARPRFDAHTRRNWDGKILLHAFTKIVPAQRNSRNRPAGTPVTHTVNVTRETYRAFVIDAIHATVATWPSGSAKIIRFQQDNATPHIKPDDVQFNQVADHYRQPENGGWVQRHIKDAPV